MITFINSILGFHSTQEYFKAVATAILKHNLFRGFRIYNRKFNQSIQAHYNLPNKSNGIRLKSSMG